MKINISLILLSVALLPVKSATAGNCNVMDEKTVLFYETDGHYWTVLVVATMLHIPEAEAIAYAAEYPDNVINDDGYIVRTRFTFLYPKAQKEVHALTGGNPEYERLVSRNMFKGDLTARQKGIASHRLGDSYAHTNDKTGKMYPHIIAHLFHWKKPDKIKTNPHKYLSYVYALIESLGGKNAEVDMTVFNYIAKANLNSVMNAAILKTEYNILTNSIAFNVDDNELPEVKKYLSERLVNEAYTYVIHTNTDEKEKVTTSIINTAWRNEEWGAPKSILLSNPALNPNSEILASLYPKNIPVLPTISNELPFSGPKNGNRDKFYLSIAFGPVFGLIKCKNCHDGSDMKMEGNGSSVDFQVGGAIKKNVFIHGTITVKSIYGPVINSTRMDDDYSVDETMVGIGLTHYLKKNVFLTGNIGLGTFSLTDQKISEYTDSGFSFQLKAGKEWNIVNKFSIGFAFMYSGTLLTNNANEEAEGKWRSNRYGFMITSTLKRK